MTEQAPPTAGWYEDPARGNQTHYWDGTNWASPREQQRHAHQLRQAEIQRTRNTKLATIGHLSWISAAVGGVCFFASSSDIGFLPPAIAFFSVAAGLWVTWLATGAIVDAINNSSRR